MPGFARGLPQTQAAVVYARRMHAGQRRADGTPFILHPLEVGSLLCHAGAPDHLIAAGVMHDLIEKAGVTAFELTGEFGPTVTRLVVAVSEDGKIADYGRRKAALRRQVEGAGPEALTLFAADKLSKLRELPRRDHPRRRVGSDRRSDPAAAHPPGALPHVPAAPAKTPARFTAR